MLCGYLGTRTPDPTSTKQSVLLIFIAVNMKSINIYFFLIFKAASPPNSRVPKAENNKSIKGLNKVRKQNRKQKRTGERVNEYN